MLEALLGFAAALPVIVLLVWQVNLLRSALDAERARTLDLLDRLGSRDYEQYAAVKRFVEPWDEDAVNPQNETGERIFMDPTGLFEVASPPLPGESVD